MSNNPQFVRTDKAIIQALISLLERKPFEKITVQDILNETPVTRATFYAHYRDKYEIAEKMLGHFLTTRKNMRKLKSSHTQHLSEFDGQPYGIDRDYAQALLKIRTETVDLRKALAAELEQEYLAGADSPTREVEASIYAQAYVELYLTLMSGPTPDHPHKWADQVLVEVALKLLRLESDSETRAFLKDRMSRSPLFER